MIQLQILSGKQAGSRWIARRFPVRIGRSQGNDLQLEEPGVWDRHCEIALDHTQGFLLSAQADALLTVNQEAVAGDYHLRNGDSIECGSIRLRFWLGDPKHRGLWVGEWFVWMLVVAICAVQLALVYWLLN